MQRIQKRDDQIIDAGLAPACNPEQTHSGRQQSKSYGLCLLDKLRHRVGIADDLCLGHFWLRILVTQNGFCAATEYAGRIQRPCDYSGPVGLGLDQASVLRGSGVVFLGLLAWSSTAGAAPCDVPKPIRFAAGANAAEVIGGIARGELACFTIAARRGQFMVISHPAEPGSAAIMQIYRPPWTIVRSADGIRVRGRALPGAAEGEDATSWAGTIPQNGRYLLVLGASWGGVEYHLHVEIR